MGIKIKWRGRRKGASRPITQKDPPASWAASQTGPREQNEDNYGRADQYTPDYQWEYRGCLYVVADGMGGLEGGKQAAQTAVRTVIQSYRNDNGRSHDVEPNLVHAMENANQQIYTAAVRKGTRMGSTLVACVLKDGKATISHVGDSRAYHLSAQGLLQRCTKDHLYATEVLGIPDDDQAKRSPEGNKITRALGKDSELKVETKVVDYGLGDRFLLCSDGLSEALSFDVIGDCLREPTPEKAVHQLCALSEKRLRDNATAVVVFASGNKIRRKKRIRQVAIYAAGVVLACGVAFGAYVGWKYLPTHTADLSANGKNTGKNVAPDTKARSDNAAPIPGQQSEAGNEGTRGTEQAYLPKTEQTRRGRRSNPPPAQPTAANANNAAKPDVGVSNSRGGVSHTGSDGQDSPKTMTIQTQLGDVLSRLASAVASLPKSSAVNPHPNDQAGPSKTPPAVQPQKNQPSTAPAYTASPGATGAAPGTEASTNVKTKTPTPGTSSTETVKSKAEAAGRNLTVRNSTSREIAFWEDDKKSKTKLKAGASAKLMYSKTEKFPKQICWQYTQSWIAATFKGPRGQCEAAGTGPEVAIIGTKEEKQQK